MCVKVFYSLPLIYALKENKQALLPYLNKKENMSHEDAQAVFDIVHQTSAIQKAQDLAAKYTNKALKGIAKLPDNQVQTKENLAHLTKAILTREN